MAKSLKEQLAGLVGGKKPNVFYKGLNLDTDSHLVGNEQYVDATNVRLNNKDNDLASIQNIASTTSAGTFGLTGWKFTPTTTGGKLWWFEDGVEASNHDISQIRFTFTDTTGASIVAVNIGAEESDFDWGLGFEVNANNYSASNLIYHCYEKLRKDTTFLASMNVTLVPPNSRGDLPSLYFFPVDQTKTAANIALFGHH